MRHRMTLHNGRTGDTYELVLEKVGASWQGRWQTLDSPDGPRGSATADDAYELFQAAKDAIEDADEDVIGVDWQFEDPLPPWMSA